MGWTWSEQDIMRNLNVTDNVAAFVSDNIMKLPPGTRHTLQIASCFGAHFDITLLSHAMKGADVSKAMELAIQDGLIEKITPLLYKFSHDRIHRAAYEFASPKKREALHYTIGRMVKELMAESSANDAIFIVADQLNKGCNLIQTTEEKLELAALNLEAAQKAKENSAFYPAAEYLNIGISMIDKTERWTEANYSLSLSLYTLLVEMEHCVGHYDACYRAVAQIVLHGRSLDDKVPSLLLQIDALGSEGNAVRAIKEATELLRQLRERFPRNPGKVSIASEFIKTKIMLRGRSDEELANLPLIVGSMNVVMELLAMICSFAFHAGMTDHYSMAGFRMMKLSLKHGLYSPFVFAVYGK
jgi:predicted ATPase